MNLVRTPHFGHVSLILLAQLDSTVGVHYVRQSCALTKLKRTEEVGARDSFGLSMYAAYVASLTCVRIVW